METKCFICLLMHDSILRGSSAVTFEGRVSAFRRDVLRLNVDGRRGTIQGEQTDELKKMVEDNEITSNPMRLMS